MSYRVFVSHSTADKYVALKVAEDIRREGGKSWVDTKDIETGSEIADEVLTAIKDSDEVLIMISPSSITNPWIFIEIGMALACRKRVVPILLQVEVNALPSVINNRSARNINDLHMYLSELRRRIEGQSTETQEVLASGSAHVMISSFAPVSEMRVRIVEVAPSDQGPAWNPEMNEFLGMEATILEVEDVSGGPYVRLDVDSGAWRWAPRWLHLRRD